MNEYKVLHLFSGLGGAALGFQRAVGEYRGMVGRFRTLAGVDVDAEACEDFHNLTGAPAVQMDLFSRIDYEAFHGHEPAPGWRETSAEDILAATGGEHPDVVFLSPPCKGFSGLLPSKSADSEKYQALNRLVIRGLQLILDAFADDLPAVILLENVPRITSRGEFLLHQVKSLLGRHGYLFHEGTHDCGELGGLGQHRKRYLLMARNREKMPSFIYKPPKRRVRSIGEIIGPLPMPDDPAMGPLHRLPRLQWKTWVRLALIPAGGDWRDLEKIAPEQYRLEYIPRGGGAYGVQEWDRPGATVTGSASVKGSNAVSVSDPRLQKRDNRHPGVYQVVKYDDPAPCITGTRFGSGAPAVADPRVSGGYSNKRKVLSWDEPATTVTGTPDIQSGAQSIADPRLDLGKNAHHALFQVGDWDKPAKTVTGVARPNNGVISVADPRLNYSPRNGSYGVQDWDKPGNTVIGAGDIHAGAAAVADPRIPADTEQGAWVIVALDGTWHRPLTTLELAALQGLPVIMPDGSPLHLAGNSDARFRERIGNAVPPPTAEAIADEVLCSLLNTRGELRLSMSGIWVVPADVDRAILEVEAYARG